MAKLSREFQAERRQEGLCCSCNESAVKGGRCEVHAVLVSVQSKERREARIASGLCGCGHRPPAPDRISCQVCLDKANKRRRKEPVEKIEKPLELLTSYQKRKDADKCQRCEQSPLPGHVYCHKHLLIKREETAMKKAKGICIDCSNDRLPDRTRCADCLQKRRDEYNAKTAAGICTSTGCDKSATHGKKCEEHMLLARKYDKIKRRRCRDEAFAQYGGYKCMCPGCTCTVPEFLQLDHINNDGWKHRREIGGKQNIGSGKMLYWLKRNGWPKIVQPMCANCNFAKGHYGECPCIGTPH